MARNGLACSGTGDGFQRVRSLAECRRSVPHFLGIRSRKLSQQAEPGELASVRYLPARGGGPDGGQIPVAPAESLLANSGPLVAGRGRMLKQPGQSFLILRQGRFALLPGGRQQA